MAARTADRVVAQAAKRLRPGKVLVDWSQNDRHKSTVAPYPLRAKLFRPTVSAPLAWEEVAAAVEDADAGALLPGPADVLDRLAARGDLFAPVLARRQTLPG